VYRGHAYAWTATWIKSPKRHSRNPLYLGDRLACLGVFHSSAALEIYNRDGRKKSNL